MSNYLEELNDIQRAAVTNTDGPVMVIAGPGSGKTRVLTYRIAHLIEKGVPPYQILSLTFTNKAAREMKERIEKVVGDKARQVMAGTFHSIFARILRAEAEKIGYPSSFTIYDTDDSKSLLTTIIKEFQLAETHKPNVIRNRISSAKSNLITPKAYANDQRLLYEDKMAKRPHTIKIYQEYVKRCKRAGAMDFDDLLYQFFYLLHINPDNVLDKYRQRFKYLLVDEFQDTNFLQYAIIKKLVNYPGSGQNICIVGDDAQSIYAFRGATIDNILDFEKDYPHLKTFKLEQNYRSTEHIVQAANQVIRYNPKQLKKTIWSAKGEGQKIKLVKTMTDTEEGKRVAGLILEQKTRNHLHNKDIAILYRTNSQSRVFEESLRRHDINYKVFGGTSFYQRKEIKDFLAYLRLIINPMDEEALKRIINYPRRGIGKSSLDKMITYAAQADKPLYECLTVTPLGTAAKRNVNKFVNMMGVFAQRADSADAYELAIYAAKQSGIMDLLKQDTTIEGMGRLENLNALLDGIKEFTEDDVIEEGEDETLGEDRSLAAYLQSIALYTDQDKEDDGDFVTLMTTHAAKGLEFPSVFVVGLEEDLFPSFMAKSENNIDEERRLFYVAITRAEAHLTLSYAKSRYSFGKMRYNEPSRFLDEISQEHLDGVPDSQFTAAPGPGYSGGSTPGKKLQGNFKPIRKASQTPVIDPKDFKPSPASSMKEGQRVLHLRFGQGVIVSTDGSGDKRFATVEFNASGKKRLMLKFAKLQILD